MTPATGYHVADVLVDGASVGAVITYTFTNVTADATISVTFAADKKATSTTLKASAKVVKVNKYVTLTGKLVGGDSHCSLRFEVMKPGQKTYKLMKVVKVGASGVATCTTKVTAKGTWMYRVRFLGDDTHLPAPLKSGIKVIVSRTRTARTGCVDESTEKGKGAMAEQTNNKLNRRDFLKKSAVVGGAAGLAGSLGLPGVAAAATSTADWLPKKWDYTADVVVAGYGFAGQAVAIEAAKAGSSVFILEKTGLREPRRQQPRLRAGHAGPVTRDLGRLPGVHQGDDGGPGLAHRRTARTSPATTRSGSTSRRARDNVEWFKSMGYDVSPANNGGGPGKWIPFFPTFPGADAIAGEDQFWTCTSKDPAGEPKAGDVWANLEVYISKQKNIKIKYETPVKRLVQNPKTREVLGVVVTQAGKEKTIKASKAVAICAGGYEYNEEWARNFQQMTHLYSIGAPSNTGETIQMAWDAGAQPRNMAVVTAPTYNCAVVPGYKAPIQLAYTAKAGAFIMVGRNNKRFKDEYRSPVTGIANKAIAGLEGTLTYSGQQIQNGAYVKQPWPEPIHYIFDEAARLAGPLFTQGGTFGWATCVEGFKNSADNSAELASGWIVKADTIRELATKIGRNPDQLQASVDRWNADCAAGKDKQFDLGDPNYAPYKRPAARLVPFTTGPFYALEVHQCTLNTQGGMTRNTNGQVLGIDGKYIPRLYAAGENGDIWTILYQCMSNVGGGCFAYGRHAGQHAAALKRWK